MFKFFFLNLVIPATYLVGLLWEQKDCKELGHLESLILVRLGIFLKKVLLTNFSLFLFSPTWEEQHSLPFKSVSISTQGHPDFPFYLGNEVVVVGQVCPAVHAAITSVTVVQVGLKGFGFGQPHHCGWGHEWENPQESCEESDSPYRDCT